MHTTIYVHTFLVISWFFSNRCLMILHMISLQTFNFFFANRFLSFLFYFIITNYVIIISMIFFIHFFLLLFFYFYFFFILSLFLFFLFYQLFNIRGCCIDIERVHDWCVETCLVKDPSQQVRLPILSLLQHFISISLYWWLFFIYNFFLFYLIFSIWKLTSFFHFYTFLLSWCHLHFF